MPPLIVALHVILCTQFNGTQLRCEDRVIARNVENPDFTIIYCRTQSMALVSQYVITEVPNGWQVYGWKCAITNKPQETPT